MSQDKLKPSLENFHKLDHAHNELRNRLGELREFDPTKCSSTSDPRIRQWLDAYMATLIAGFGADSEEEKNYRVGSLHAGDIDNSLSAAERAESFARGKERAIYQVRRAIYRSIELVDEEPTFLKPPADPWADPEFRRYRDFLLISLASRDAEEGPWEYEVNETAYRTGMIYREGWVERAARDLHHLGVIDAGFHSNGPDVSISAKMTEQGRREAVALLTKGSVQAPEGSSILSASDRIVTLDHNSSRYIEAVEAIDAVIARLRTDNEFGEATTPEDRERTTNELETGKKLLESARIRVGPVRVLIVGCLQDLGRKFRDTAIGRLAAIAVAKLFELIGM